MVLVKYMLLFSLFLHFWGAFFFLFLAIHISVSKYKINYFLIVSIFKNRGILNLYAFIELLSILLTLPMEPFRCLKVRFLPSTPSLLPWANFSIYLASACARAKVKQSETISWCSEGPSSSWIKRLLMATGKSLPLKHWSIIGRSVSHLELPYFESRYFFQYWKRHFYSVKLYLLIFCSEALLNWSPL